MLRWERVEMTSKTICFWTKEVVGCSELVANVVLQVNVKDKWRWEPDPFEGYSLKAKCMLFSTSLYKWDFVVVKKLV
jgi:hypothetical protein